MNRFIGLAVLCAVLALSGCSGGPGEQAGPQSSPTATGYAGCMRSHGVPDFPDPDSRGGYALGRIDPHTPEYQAAYQACEHLI